jgi:hypothetical protein
MADPTPPAYDVVAVRQLTKKWNQRIATATSRGFDANKVKNIARDDYLKVIAGGHPMSEEEALTSVMAAHGGTPPVQKSPATGILGTIGNIIPDVGSTLWNFPRGFEELIHHLPSELSTVSKIMQGDPTTQQKIGWESFDPQGSVGSNVAKLSRDLSRVPLVNLIPGVHDVAALTTGTGRKALQQHPVGAALDILPYAGPLAEAGVMGEGAQAAIEAGKAADLAERTGAVEVPSATAGQKAAAALAQGKPIKAFVRAIAPLDETRLATLRRFHVDPVSIAGMRKTREITFTASRQFSQRVHDVDHITHKLGEAEQSLLHEKVTRPDLHPPSKLSVEDQAKMQLIREYNATELAIGKSHGFIDTPFNIGDRAIYYAGEDLTKINQVLGDVAKAGPRIIKAEDRLSLAQDRHDAAIQAGDEAGILKAKLSVKRAIAEVKRTQEVSKKVSRKAWKTIRETAPANFQPMLEAEIMARVKIELGAKFEGDTPMFNKAMDALNSGGVLEDYLTPKRFNKIRREVASTWQQLVLDGHDPIFVHSATNAQLEHVLSPMHLGVTATKPGVFRRRTMDLTSGSSHLSLLMSQAARQTIQLLGIERVVQEVLRPLAKTTKQIDAEIDPVLSKSPLVSESLSARRNSLRNDQYMRLSDEFLGGLPPTQTLRTLFKEDLWVPRYVGEAVKQIVRPREQTSIGRTSLGVNTLFKTSVMAFSPTHLLHIYLGGALALMLGARGEEFNPHNVIGAIRMARDTASMPEGINTSLDILSTEDVANWAHGTKIGNLLRKSVDAALFSRKVSEFGMNMYRSWAYLADHQRALKEGLSSAEANLRGVSYANKMFVDLNSMTPIEAYAIKQMFPFYAYTRYIMKYVMQYPIDHPIRASILSNLGEHESAYNREHGIANTMSMLFYFGHPDKKGDQWGLNLRAFNPFRDTATTFTKAGIFRGLGPIERGLLSSSGFNTLAGVPEPYQQLTIDPQTGQLIAKSPSAAGLKFGEAIIPQLGTLDYFLGLSSSMRSLQKTNPQAYRRQLFSLLNVPFAPQVYNPAASAERMARNKLRVSQQDVAAALKSGHLDALARYDTIPVPSKLAKYFHHQKFVSYSEFVNVTKYIISLEAAGRIRKVT